MGIDFSQSGGLSTGFHPFGGQLDPRSENFFLGPQEGGGLGFIDRLFKSPIFSGLTNFILSGNDPGAFFRGAATSRDLAQVATDNERNDEFLELTRTELDRRAAEADARADRVPNFFDPSTGQIFGPDAGQVRPGLRGGGFTQPGKPLGRNDINANLITLPDFTVGQAALEGFQENLPSLPERTIGFDPLSQIGRNFLFNQIEELGVLPETDLSEVLGARLGGIGAAGVGREQQRLQQVAALAPQFGGLENLRGTLGGVSASEGALRGLESQQAVGQTRGEELAAQQFVSQLAGGLAGDEARLNTAIGQFNLGSQFTVDNTNISRELAIAQTLSGLQAGAANDPIQRTSFITDAINQSLGLQSNLFNASTTNQLNALAAQIPLLQNSEALFSSFLPIIMPNQFGGGQTGGGGSSFNLDATSAIGAGAGLIGTAGTAAGSFAVPAGAAAGTAVGLGAAGTAGAAGAAGTGLVATYGAVKTVIWFICIDGDSGISVPGGQKKLKDIEVGDVVYDWSHNETEVIDKDLGWTTGARRDEFVRIQTDLTHLVCTKDHQIDGRRADSYVSGEQIQTALGDAVVESVEPCNHVSCGDLKLANRGNYIANGFRVNSMFKFYGIEKQITPVKEKSHGL